MVLSEVYVPSNIPNKGKRSFDAGNRVKKCLKHPGVRLLVINLLPYGAVACPLRGFMDA